MTKTFTTSWEAHRLVVEARESADIRAIHQASFTTYASLSALENSAER